MKNLLIYIGNAGKFSREHDVLTRIQIDNSLDLGWKPEDIILATNFDWEYRGVKALKLEGNFDALDGNRSSKILVINRLFDMGKILDGDMVWFHDHDAFELVPIEEPKLYPEVASFTTEGWMDRWNAGSFFFTRGAADLFQKIYSTMIERGTNEQDALTHLWSKGLPKVLLDNSYNLGIYHIPEVLKTIQQPLRVAHFHPHKPRHMDLFRELIPERLMAIFNKYGLK